MEDVNLYNADKKAQVFAFRYVFLPRINAALKGFTDGWNNHPLLSEGGLSPMQLWVSGITTHPNPRGMSSTSKTIENVVTSKTRAYVFSDVKY